MPSCLTLEACKQVITSLVQPVFDYADVAWGENSVGVAKSSSAYETVQLELFFKGKIQKTLSVRLTV